MSALADAFEAACLAETRALKPGNVHGFAAGHGMTVRQFELAAAAAAPAIARPGAGVGARIEAAVRTSLDAAGCNTNLGIVLLCAPLAAAAEGTGELRGDLSAVLSNLTVDDAQATFRAIAAANPGGLGSAEQHDVTLPARVTLLEAMGAAADRDRIARQYVTGFADVFAIGLASMPDAPVETAAQAVYLAFLSAFPDTHILRKFGTETAETVRSEAENIVAGLPPSGAARHRTLIAFDARLKQDGLNPGTSADLTVASLFAASIIAGRQDPAD